MLQNTCLNYSFVMIYLFVYFSCELCLAHLCIYHFNRAGKLQIKPRLTPLLQQLILLLSCSCSFGLFERRVCESRGIFQNDTSLS